MENPYKTHKGYGLRVHHAKKAITKLGLNRFADIYTRGFDNCFEHYDGSAVVFALMHEAKNGNETLLQGIRNMGEKLIDDWEALYMQGMNKDKQKELFIFD